jgi:cell division protein FtsB
VGTGHKLVYIVVGTIAAVLYLSGSTLKTMFNLKSDVSSYEEKLSKLKKGNEEFACELEWLESKDEYVKYLARKKLGMVEPDEVKYYILETSNINNN